VLDEFEQLFNQGLYKEAIAAAAQSAEPTARHFAVRGISLLRLGDASNAENLLKTAMDFGDEEAHVEYGNFLRASGRFQDAIEFLNNLLPELTGVFKARGTRWLGVAQYQQGKTRIGLTNLEKARRDFEYFGEILHAAKVKHTLFVVYDEIGEHKKAGRLLKEAITEFRRSSDTNLLINGLRNLIDIHISHNEIEKALMVLDEIRSLLSAEVSPQHIHYWVPQAFLLSKKLLDKSEILGLFDLIIENSERYGDYENLIWGIVKKAEFLLESNNTSEAMRLVYQAPQDANGMFPFQVRIVRAMINRRMGNLREAIAELQLVAQDLENAENVSELARVRLQLAYAMHLDSKPEMSPDKVADVLRAALQGLLRTNIQPGMRPELEEMSELLHYAAMEPSLAPYLAPVMDSLAGVSGGGDNADVPAEVQLQVHTLGQVSILNNGDPVVFQLKGTVPLLVYLALTPNRTIHEILADLHPEKEPTAGSTYVRRCISELRELLGHHAVLTEGPHRQSRYRLGAIQLDLDLTRCLDAVQQGKLPRALALYRGDFLPGSDESEWVLQKREAARLSLTFELHNQIALHRERQEWRRVILLTNQYLRVDPHDMEVHEMRVDAARRVGTAAELGRFVAAMNSTLN
jgi:DNA-binding SARP family transcriptional activator